jgi:hypothetical protein
VPLAELKRRADQALAIRRDEAAAKGLKGRTAKAATGKDAETWAAQDLKIRDLMERYYCAPELMALGCRRRIATAHLVDEVKLH